MYDPAVRVALAYGILGVVALAGAGFLVWYLRRSYWAKLRRAGDPRAKEREMARGKSLI